ncbi:MAG: FtsX-like permease family protein [Clostridia bacterium]|nr:FtsX-like permease family protein [Clostridia bacterium]
MLFKLSFKNMKKSIKDYSIYFLTLVLGVCIFYMFNSLDSQQAMLQVSKSQKEMIHLMIDMLGMISIFVAVVLGLLIVYANNFLVNRRKKEFGIYMTLGMGRRQISKIILIETIFIGIISLAIGLVAGIFASQFMSILVAKMFEANMNKFEFVFSKAACIKTCIYFAIMYLAVIVFNTITISRYKLIDLLHASKKNEKVKMKNPFLAILVFIAGSTILGYAYWKVTADAKSLVTADKLLPPILMGIIGTVAIFWSLSGFMLEIIKRSKKIYLKDTNMFVLRQINNKINTMVISMSLICLMLFMTISILSSALSIKNTMQRELVEMTPVDINLVKMANLPEESIHYGRKVTYTEAQREESKLSIKETMINNNFDMNKLKDIIEIPAYIEENIKLSDFLGDKYEETKKEYPGMRFDTVELIVKVSDYNKIAKLYGIDQYKIEDDEYIVVCDYDVLLEIRNRALKNNGKNTLNIAGKEYKSKYNECKPGFVMMNVMHANTGIILVPDNCKLADEDIEERLLVANYNADTEEDKQKIEELFTSNESGFVQSLANQGIEIDGMTRISLYESSVGLATIVTFIAIYLGIIFLITSSAILALKQLTESSDNRQRYLILRKIGCDEKMINKSLFRQVGIFFGAPLLLAVIHSIFGIKFALYLLSGLASEKDLLPSVIATVIVMIAIYGTYFMATYLGSKNIVKED